MIDEDDYLHEEELQPPKHIKTVGTIVIIFGALALVSSIVFLIAMSILADKLDDSILAEMQEEFTSLDVNFDVAILEYMFDNAFKLFFPSIIVGLLFLIGGINFRKYKSWSIPLLTIASVLNLFISGFTLYLFNNVLENIDAVSIYNSGIFSNVIIYAIPVLLLIWYVNKKSLKPYFDNPSTNRTHGPPSEIV